MFQRESPIEFFTQPAEWEKMNEVSLQAGRVERHLEGRTIFSNDLMDPGQNLVFIAEICNTTFERHQSGEI